MKVEMLKIKAFDQGFPIRWQNNWCSIEGSSQSTFLRKFNKNRTTVRFFYALNGTFSWLNFSMNLILNFIACLNSRYWAFYVLMLIIKFSFFWSLVLPLHFTPLTLKQFILQAMFVQISIEKKNIKIVDELMKEY